MFLQNCYIHKRTPELIQKVIDLGYRYYNQYDNTCDSLHTRIGTYYTSPHFVDEHYSDMEPDCDFDGIDCGENEELFLAIAALQDDTDENQWFVYPEENHWFKCYDNNIDEVRNEPSTRMSCQAAWFYNSHKASIEELINHFK